MKILIVCSFNNNRISPFILEQVKSLKKFKIEFDFYTIKGRGILGYLKNLFSIKKKLEHFRPNIIHAHYGLSGLLANMQRKIPVITTFHGSDLNNPKIYKYSRLTNKLSSASIFVNQSNAEKGCKNRSSYIIPCAVDLSIFKRVSKYSARQRIGYSQNEIFILFSSSFKNKVKNYPLAKKSCTIVQSITSKKVNLIELQDYSRDEVNLLINSSDCALLTSFSEGSPQFIKEAMSCNCPIVATNVGDIEWLIGDEPGHFLASFDPQDVAEKIKAALEFSEKHGRTKGRERIIELELYSETVAMKIYNVYESVFNKNH